MQPAMDRDMIFLPEKGLSSDEWVKICLGVAN